jgi:small subunit ribosomal protein S2
MLTNFQTVHQRINRLKELDEIDFEDVAGSSRTKKELLQMRRERDKLNKSLGGIREMSRTPAAVWIVDTNKEHLAVEEARKLRIPIIGILDSNCDPDEVDFPIPGNDDAIRAVGLLTRVVADAVAEGLIARSGAKTEGAEAGAEEPLAEWERELLGGDAEQSATTAAAGETTDAPAAEAPAAEAPAADAPAAEAPAADAPAAEAPAPEAPAAEAPAAEAPAAEAPPAEAAADSTTDPAGADGGFGPDSAAPLADGSAPEGFEIKGNKNSMKFHAPSSPWYARTNAEVWFRSAAAAEAAGFSNAEADEAATAEA